MGGWYALDVLYLGRRIELLPFCRSEILEGFFMSNWRGETGLARCGDGFGGF